MSKRELIPFMSGEFGQLRVIDLGDGKVHFMGRDAALALGYANPSKAVQSFCKNGVRITTSEVPSLGISNTGRGGCRWAIVIPEADLYRLVMRSKLPTAERFQDWVVEEVLPQIRKTGGYIPVTEEDDELTIMSKAVQIMQRTLEQKDTIIAEKQAVITEKLEYATVDSFRALHVGEYWTHGMSVKMGKKATALCRDRDIPISYEVKIVNSPMYGRKKVYVNKYPTNILFEVWEGIKEAA